MSDPRRRARDPAASPGAAQLGELDRALPATTHLVLSGRSAPELPLSRHEAAGELLRIGADELSVTDTGGVRARATARAGSGSGPVRGWPASMRLAFAAGPGAQWRYAREEILGRVPAGWRRALAALASRRRRRSPRSPANLSTSTSWSPGSRW